MKTTLTLTNTLILTSLIGISQAATTLDFRPNSPGNGTTVINVTSGSSATPLSEVASAFVDDGGRRDGTPLPILGSWGGVGLDIDGQQTTFTVNSITDFDGSTSSTAGFRADMTGNGFGIQSTNGNWFEIDGAEAFSWSASIPLQWEGMSLRQWNNTGSREMLISSADWVGLLGVSPGTGITYDSVAGSFLLEEVAGNVMNDEDVSLLDLVGASGPTLDFSTIIMANASGAAGDGTAIQTMTFAAAPVPEPSSSVLMGLAGLALIMRRRK